MTHSITCIGNTLHCSLVLDVIRSASSINPVQMMFFFRKSQQYLEFNYKRIYDVFHWCLSVILLRIFDDDFLVAPIPTAIFRFYQSEVALCLVIIVMHAVSYRNDLDAVILSVSAFVSVFEMFIKLNGMAYRRKQIAQMIRTVLNDRSHLNGPMEARICEKYQRLARKLLFITILSYLTTCIMLLSYPVLVGGIQERILPVGFSIPLVDYHKHPWYLINYLIQIVQGSWVALVFIGLDGPFYLFVCYSASQLEILIEYVRRIGECPDDAEEQRRLIRKVFELHTDLSKFLARCSSIYREVYLIQILCSIVHICVSLFHIQIKFINGSYGMLLTNVNKVWLFCYCGELVVSKAADFSTGVYTNQWYQLWNRRDLQDMLFMLQNAQRNYGFSVGGFGFLSFATFTAVMKTAYSCNAFLHRVMN
ncbi:odorant receptor 4-like [Anopheles moucheti]|uniref:odorant receptor 4-like n=1 Tax=Anopheles moucheti TaxID=186751 RepID=UPI0022F1136F|nr:odorant receptor 4-like [Anopheles moucheti]